LFLVYQPKMNSKTGFCDSFEALARWNHATRGMISPVEFIELAEESGLINFIGKWILDQACSRIHQIKVKYQKQLKMAVNISTVQLNSEDFVRVVKDTLQKYQLEPEYLELEITESVLIDSSNGIVEKLRQLHEYGVEISIDDFGKGYSSLAYLRKLPISTLKIDKMFIDEIGVDGDVLVGDIIKLGHHMGLKTIAEGVETQEQLSYLTDSGCDRIQGYIYSKPMKTEQLNDFLEKETTAIGMLDNTK
jgi:EAL domain-containing protein (putative c-di-GMP-specific phosphodiesterase class I)